MHGMHSLTLDTEIKKLEDGKNKSIHLRLDAPVIGMFEKDVRETVKLSAIEYRMLVEDE